MKFFNFRLLCMLTAFAGSTSVFGQTLKEWDDVSITNVNRETAHTLSIPAKSVIIDNSIIHIYGFGTQ